MDNTSGIHIEDGFKNRDKIIEMVENVENSMGISNKLESTMIKLPPHGHSIDMNYLNDDGNSLDLEIVDSLENLEGRTRHELMHVMDQLDNRFNYIENNVPGEGSGAHRRYKYLWNVYIDSRLLRSEKPAYESREGREKEMGECYPELSVKLRTEIFDYLWELTPLNHTQITEMSYDLFSKSERLMSFSQSYGEKLHNFETLEDLKKYRR